MEVRPHINEQRPSGLPRRDFLRLSGAALLATLFPQSALAQTIDSSAVRPGTNPDYYDPQAIRPGQKEPPPITPTPPIYHAPEDPVNGEPNRRPKATPTAPIYRAPEDPVNGPPNKRPTQTKTPTPPTYHAPKDPINGDPNRRQTPVETPQVFHPQPVFGMPTQGRNPAENPVDCSPIPNVRAEVKAAGDHLDVRLVAESNPANPDKPNAAPNKIERVDWESFNNVVTNVDEARPGGSTQVNNRTFEFEIRRAVYPRPPSERQIPSTAVIIVETSCGRIPKFVGGGSFANF